MLRHESCAPYIIVAGYSKWRQVRPKNRLVGAIGRAPTKGQAEGLSQIACDNIVHLFLRGVRGEHTIMQLELHMSCIPEKIMKPWGKKNQSIRQKMLMDD
jgi:hypothetical protein